jgi:uncharacterized damage-inducible protein DinB
MSEKPRVLTAPAGFSPGIGFYLAGMEEVRGQLMDAVIGMSSDDIGRAAVAGAHSIGALILHIGESEWWWMQCIVSGHKLTAEDRSALFWDILKSPESFEGKGYSAKFCLDEAAKIRRQTRDILATFTDQDLERVFNSERRGKTYEHTLRWILHHLIDHEAQHKGQIFMLKRLLGSANNGAFN